MNKNNIILKIIKVLILALLIIVLITNICIIVQTKTNPHKVPNIFGFKPFIVLSGSMESQINVGDLVIVKEIDPIELKVGDIIAFRDPEDIVTTHRIVDILTKDNEIYFTTKGDNNNTNDSDLVSSNMVEGKYQTKFAKLGNTIMFIQQPIGFVITMMSIFIICMLIYIYQNRNNNLELKFEDEKERQAFEEFKRERADKEK